MVKNSYNKNLGSFLLESCEDDHPP